MLLNVVYVKRYSKFQMKANYIFFQEKSVPLLQVLVLCRTATMYCGSCCCSQSTLQKDKLVMYWAIWFITYMIWTRRHKVLSLGKLPSKEECIVSTALFFELGMASL